MAGINLKLISNNVKGLQSSKKGLKLFEYLKNRICPNVILFLQETHSTFMDEVKWNDEFRGKIYYSHGKLNSCGVLIVSYGDEKINVKKRLTDKNGRILILDIEIDNSEYIPTSLCNSNTELEQLYTLEERLSLLNNVELEAGKHSSGDFNLYFNISLDAKGVSPMLAKCSLGKIIEIIERLDVYDIWRMRDPKVLL